MKKKSIAIASVDVLVSAYFDASNRISSGVKGRGLFSGRHYALRIALIVLVLFESALTLTTLQFYVTRRVIVLYFGARKKSKLVVV